MLNLPAYVPPAPREKGRARQLTMDLGNGARMGMVACRNCEALWLGLWHWTELWLPCLSCGQTMGREVCTSR